MDLKGVRQRLGAAARIASAASLAMGLALADMTAPRAQGPDPDSPGQAPSVLTAETLVYSSNDQLITATGDVEISTGRRRLLADEVRYDQRTGKMFAHGNVVLIEPNGDKSEATSVVCLSAGDALTGSATGGVSSSRRSWGRSSSW